jgi:hypothetical protein
VIQTVSVEAMLAVAYVNLDGVDGYSPTRDVLIAKLVDTDSDGAASVGDTIVMGEYPKDFAATSLGSFGVTSHVVTSVDSVIPQKRISVSVGDDRAFEFRHITEVNGTDITYETYDEGFSFCIEDPGGLPGDEVCIRSTTTFEDTVGGSDRIATDASSPSVPDANLSLSRGSSTTDDAFVDVDVFI